MREPLVYQNLLMAGMFEDNHAGFKDKRDPCNKTNKSNGGDFVTYARSGYWMDHYLTCAVKNEPLVSKHKLSVSFATYKRNKVKTTAFRF